jgi:hypothetical protein
MGKSWPVGGSQAGTGARAPSQSNARHPVPVTPSTTQNPGRAPHQTAQAARIICQARIKVLVGTGHRGGSAPRESRLSAPIYLRRVTLMPSRMMDRLSWTAFPDCRPFPNPSHQRRDRPPGEAYPLRKRGHSRRRPRRAAPVTTAAAPPLPARRLYRAPAAAPPGPGPLDGKIPPRPGGLRSAVASPPGSCRGRTGAV